MNKHKLKKLLNDPVASLTNRSSTKNKTCKTLTDSINDENFLSKHYEAYKSGVQARKYSWNDSQLSSERKINGIGMKSPKNTSSQIIIPKIGFESPQNRQQSFYLNGLPQLNKMKTNEQSQIAIDFKKVDSTILTVNTNEQLMEAQIERNSLLQNNFKQLTSKVLNMLESLRQNDNERLEQTLEEIIIFLQQTCRTELELSKMVNLSLKQSNKISHINLVNQRLSEKLSFFQEKDSLNNYKAEELQEKYLKCIIEINSQKKMIQNQKKKIEQLEQRLDFLLASDFINEQQIPKYQNIRKVLTELVKENENLKREKSRKDDDVKRLQEQKLTSHLKLNLLNQKIESLKSRISIKDLEDSFYDQGLVKVNQKQISTYKNTNNILQNDEIPEKIDFRINQLRNEYKSLMIDLCEHGSNIFIEQYLNTKDEKKKIDWLKLILSQFMSYKEFSEKSNKVSQMLHHLETIDSIDELLRQTNIHLKQIFKCTQAHAWIYDQYTGILFTIKEDKSELRALNSKGLFSEIIKHQLASNKSEQEEFIIYEQIMLISSLQQSGMSTTSKQKTEKQENWIYSDSSLCLPLTSKSSVKKQTIGILEITGSKCKIFNIDDEYWAVLISQYLNNQIQRIKQVRIKSMENRYKDFLQDSFLEMIKCKEKVAFTNTVGMWLQRIFTITQFRLYFVKDGYLYNYLNQEFSSKHGWAGYVLSINQAIIVQSIKSTDNFDPLVDIYSILPIQIIPISIHNRIVAVLEIPIKRCNRTPSVQDDLTFSNSPFMGLDNSFDNAMKSFCNHISVALSHNQVQ